MFKYHSIDGCEIDLLDEKYIVLAPPGTSKSKLIANGFSLTEEGLWGKFITYQEYQHLSCGWQENTGCIESEIDLYWEEKKRNAILIVLMLGVVAGIAIQAVTG